MKKKLYHCSGCTENDPLGGTHSYDTIEHGEQPIVRGKPYQPDNFIEEVCVHCNKRPATTNWVGNGGILEYSHGMYERWCDHCCTFEQLKAARKAAKQIPTLEKRLKKLK